MAWWRCGRDAPPGQPAPGWCVRNGRARDGPAQTGRRPTQRQQQPGRIATGLRAAAAFNVMMPSSPQPCHLATPCTRGRLVAPHPQPSTACCMPLHGSVHAAVAGHCTHAWMHAWMPLLLHARKPCCRMHVLTQASQPPHLAVERVWVCGGVLLGDPGADTGGSLVAYDHLRVLVGPGPGVCTVQSHLQRRHATDLKARHAARAAALAV